MSAGTVGNRGATTGQPGVVRVLTSVAGVTTVCVSPVFLVGGLGVQLQAEFEFGAAALGVASAGFFGIAALASRGMGWLVEWLGARSGMRLAVATSSICLLGLAASDNVVWLIGLLWASGLPTALAQPSSNLLITQGVPMRQRGMGFGIKQSAIPAATMAAGVAVPVVALTIGWRWAFVFAAVVGVLAGLLVPKLTEQGSSDQATRGASLSGGHGALLLIAFAGGLASAAANALGTFLTTTAVRIGFSPWMAGLILSVASASGLCVRLVAGVLADRKNPNLLRVITIMLVTGSAGFALIAVPAQTPFLLGAAIAFCAGWSWPGLLNFAVAKRAPDRVASATSITQTGIYFGSCVGPLSFGFVAEHLGLRGAWLVDAAAAITAGLLLMLVRNQNQGPGLRASPP